MLFPRDEWTWEYSSIFWELNIGFPDNKIEEFVRNEVI